MTNVIPSRFYSLDVVRGIAALTVVLWHWQHLLTLGETPSVAFSMEDQPFYSYLSVFYHWGWLAVDFFFSLSGFVFFWLYADAVSQGRLRAWKFFVMRFSRLYPLHILTFIFVLLAQQMYQARTGGYFVYQFNDLYHAFLNVFMASGWGIEKGPSYNGPIWSVSVEAVLYLAFFCLCAFHRARPITLVLLIVLGLMMAGMAPALARGMTSFFAGGLAFSIYNAIRQSGYARRLVPLVLVVTVLAWVAVLADLQTGRISDTVISAINPNALAAMNETLLAALRMGKLQAIAILLFPLTIISLALIETWRGTLGRRVSAIGHLSYSSYLLHFPLQLCFALVTTWVGIDRSFFYSKHAFLLFVAILIPFCFLSYYCLELPMQRYLRAALNPNRTPASSPSIG